jgi:LmbE family N-acetylglucosaminyl deacetylase
MLRLAPGFTADATVLCLGAHCDDIEIGCGGALIELAERFPGLRFEWVVFSGDEQREAETRAAADRIMSAAAGCRIELLRFRESHFPYNAALLKESIESIKLRVAAPQLIFTHFLHDRHQDHRAIAELTWNTFRNHTILEYEIPKFEGDLAHPNVYFPLSPSTVERKIDVLMRCFPSQLSRTWFDEDLFRGHMRLRGVECNSPSRFAEAFHGRKLTI